MGFGRAGREGFKGGASWSHFFVFLVVVVTGQIGRDGEGAGAGAGAEVRCVG